MSGLDQPPTRDPGDNWAPAEEQAVLEAARTAQAPTKHGLAGKAWWQIRRRLEQRPEFRRAWDEARAAWVDTLEQVTETRAIDGWTETIETQDGAGRTTERKRHSKWDPKLAMSILAARKREVYGKRETIEHEIGERRRIAITLAEDAHPKAGDEGTS